MSLIGGAIVPCQSKAVFLLVLPAKIKFYSRGSFFPLNMFSLVSFFRTFSPTLGKKAVLKRSLAQSRAACVPRAPSPVFPLIPSSREGCGFCSSRLSGETADGCQEFLLSLSACVCVTWHPSCLWIALFFPFLKWNENPEYGLELKIFTKIWCYWKDVPFYFFRIFQPQINFETLPGDLEVSLSL